MTDAKKKTRTIELEIRIDAPREAVWSALTEPAELARWFPPIAEGKAGLGETLLLSWGPVLEWRTRVAVWEPGSPWCGATSRARPPSPTREPPAPPSRWRSTGRWRRPAVRWWCASSTRASARARPGTTSTTGPRWGGASSSRRSATTSSGTAARSGRWCPSGDRLAAGRRSPGTGCGARTDSRPPPRRRPSSPGSRSRSASATSASPGRWPQRVAELQGALTAMADRAFAGLD